MTTATHSDIGTKLAYRRDPSTEVKWTRYSEPTDFIVSEGPNGTERMHDADGVFNGWDGFDLVPMKAQQPQEKG